MKNKINTLLCDTDCQAVKQGIGRSNPLTVITISWGLLRQWPTHSALCFLAMTFLLLSTNAVFAQKKELKPEEIEVVKDYTPLLSDAMKINFPATIPDRTASGKLDLIYSTPEKLLPIPFEPSPLK